MRAGRLILVVATLVTILVFPVLLRDALHAFRLPNAYAAADMVNDGGRVYQNGNNNNGNSNNNNGNSNNNNGNSNNNNGNSNNNNDDNDNAQCFLNLNSNEEVPCEDNGNANRNDNGFVPAPPPPAPSAPASSASHCFAAGESGEVTLMLTGGTVTIRVVPNAPLPQGASIALDIVDPATVPAPPAGTTLFDTMVWRMSGGPCGGAAVDQLPGAVNLGIPLSIPADKSRLQIVMLSGNTWMDIPTVPDPNPSTPFISATVQQTGVYAVIQR